MQFNLGSRGGSSEPPEPLLDPPLINMFSFGHYVVVRNAIKFRIEKSLLNQQLYLDSSVGSN